MMKSQLTSESFQPRWYFTALVATVLLLALPSEQLAAQEVTTLGGGPVISDGNFFGFQDGNTQDQSQFESPHGLAVSSNGSLFVADSANGAIRQIDLNGGQTMTVVTNLLSPHDITFDPTGNLYVAETGAGRIARINFFLGSVFDVVTGLDRPSAMTFDSATNLYVTEFSGRLVKVTSAGEVTTVLNDLKSPSGIAILPSGLIAVSETTAHSVRILNPITTSTVQTIGSGNPGYRDGQSQQALFNAPQHLTVDAQGTLIVADAGNHRLRRIDGSGIVTTLAGIPPENWESCNLCFPGWADGTVDIAELRSPTGVAYDANLDTVYFSETHHHLIRQISNLSLIATTGGTINGSNSPPDGGGQDSGPLFPPTIDTGLPGQNPPDGTGVFAPLISPDSGYFPGGKYIEVIDLNQAELLPRTVYYTLDGSLPTTNSFVVPMINNRGQILFDGLTNDLSGLVVRTLFNGNFSDPVQGERPTHSRIEIPRDYTASPGSTLVVPITVNMEDGVSLQSLQFRVEIAPDNPGSPAVGANIRPLTITTNSFAPVVVNKAGQSTFDSQIYNLGDITGLALSYQGTNDNLTITDYGLVAKLAVPIPTSASNGNTYTLRILNPSGTQDGAQLDAPLIAGAPRKIEITETPYLVGDTAPGRWYNAEQRHLSGADSFGFGDGRLTNADVNNAFRASLGLSTPYPFTDAFNAMDAYPIDQPGIAGGDGKIRFLDWQVIFERSLGLRNDSWIRFRSPEGNLSALNILEFQSQKATANKPAQVAQRQPWFRNAHLRVGRQSNLAPGDLARIPVSIEPSDGSRLSGLQFLAQVSSHNHKGGILNADFIPLNQPQRFRSAPGLPALNYVGGAWGMNTFSPEIDQNALLGHIEFQIPDSAKTGDLFAIQVLNIDGASQSFEPYEFESSHGSAIVGQPTPDPLFTVQTSDQWRDSFFPNEVANNWVDRADPDQDGLSNLSEYLAGTDPHDPESSLKLQNRFRPDSTSNSLDFGWVGMLGRRYQLQTSSNASEWVNVGKTIRGTGEWIPIEPQPPHTGNHFYRVLLVEPTAP